MVYLHNATLADREDAALRAMFAARKAVFVDLLKWDLPVIDDRFEIDQFDDQHAHYIVLMDDAGQHRASARLLPTTRPHILADLFPELCGNAVPQDSGTYEITRFCIDRASRTADRLIARNQLISAMVSHALEKGIRRYTAVTDMAFLQQILSFGWDCYPLGLPHTSRSGMIGALEIRIDHQTPALLAQAGIWSPVGAPLPHLKRAAGAKG